MIYAIYLFLFFSSCQSSWWPSVIITDLAGRHLKVLWLIGDPGKQCLHVKIRAVSQSWTNSYSVKLKLKRSSIKKLYWFESCEKKAGTHYVLVLTGFFGSIRGSLCVWKPNNKQLQREQSSWIQLLLCLWLLWPAKVREGGSIRGFCWRPHYKDKELMKTSSPPWILKTDRQKVVDPEWDLNALEVWHFYTTK